MPEGDTVWLTAKRLNSALAEHVITTFDLRVPQLATSDLRGATVTEVLARGKHLLMRIDSGLTLHSHLRMDGSWRLAAAGRPTGVSRRYEHQIRALIGNTDWLALGLRVHDLSLMPTTDEASVVGHLGPDLLGPDWDAPAALARLQAEPDATIGEALLDQRNLAGIGNMYRAEVLFSCGVNPMTPVRDVANLGPIVETARRFLRRNRDHPEQSTTGSLARGEQHWVYLRGGQACRRCRTTIRSARLGPPPRDREVWWCPTCQPG